MNRLSGNYVHRFASLQPSSLRLFAFPYAGGGSHIYRKWQPSLPEGVAICPVEMPGRGQRMIEDPHRDVQALVKVLATELRAELEHPFAFFGHSMGALISFELTRYLRRHHLPMPKALLVSGHAAPQLPRLKAPSYNLPDEEFMQELRTLNGTPLEILENVELMQLMLPLLRADFEMVETYKYSPEPPFSLPIHAFGGIDDEDAEPEEMESWAEQTASHFTCQILAGDHFFLNTNSAQFLKNLASRLQPLLPRPLQQRDAMAGQLVH